MSSSSSYSILSIIDWCSILLWSSLSILSSICCFTLFGAPSSHAASSPAPLSAVHGSSASMNGYFFGPGSFEPWQGLFSSSSPVWHSIVNVSPDFLFEINCSLCYRSWSSSGPLPGGFKLVTLSLLLLFVSVSLLNNWQPPCCAGVLERRHQCAFWFHKTSSMPVLKVRYFYIYTLCSSYFRRAILLDNSLWSSSAHFRAI